MVWKEWKNAFLVQLATHAAVKASCSLLSALKVLSLMILVVQNARSAPVDTTVARVA